ncbi:MAG: DUF58 domain-containing protein [Candidatus Sumerlaeia bacterium]|nr:DUF58 domain-containing protein [Candidatus Sumerlaeia bacterium]
MPVPDLLENAADVRRLEIMTRRLVNSVMAGEYHAVFKGQGMEFNEVREYQPGDDVRFIDWNVTARSGTPFIKRYIEQRELTVIFAVDISASTLFGSVPRRKRPLATVVTSVLAFSAIRNNDRVGLMLFSDDVELYMQPRKGRGHGLLVVRELMTAPRRQRTDIVGALTTLTRLQRRKAVIFLISDFQQPGLRRALAAANSRHDLIAVTVSDPREESLPDAGLVNLEDAETGETVLVDTSSARVRQAVEARFRARREELRREFRSLAIDHIELRTDKDFAPELIGFFQKRAARLGSGR